MSDPSIDPTDEQADPVDLDEDRAPHHEIEGEPTDDERVEEAIDESFPASDPPSWTSGLDNHE